MLNVGSSAFKQTQLSAGGRHACACACASASACALKAWAVIGSGHERRRRWPSSLRLQQRRAVAFRATCGPAAAAAETKEKEKEKKEEKETEEKEKEKEMVMAPLRSGGLAGDGLSFVERFVVRCYEVGANRTATIEAVANLMQECACNHARSVGFSTDGFSTTPTMRKRHLIWVTARMHIEVYKYPLWGDLVEIETWCQAEGKLATRRDWILKDATTNTLIGRATSTWVMMHQDTRRLARVTEDVRDEYIIFFPQEPRLVFPENDVSSSKKKIYKLEDPAEYCVSALMPRRVDLDMNEHVNNVTYIGWLLESVPPEILDTHELHTITLEYRRECNKGDVVESLTSLESQNSDYHKIENNLAASSNGASSAKFCDKSLSSKDGVEFVHLIRLANGGSEINRGRSEWSRKPRR